MKPIRGPHLFWIFLKFFILGILIPSLLKAQANKGPSSIESFFQTLNSRHLQIYSQEETRDYESNLKSLHQLGLTWTPELEIPNWNSENKNPCSPKEFKQELLRSSSLENKIKQSWSQCEPQWRLNSYNPLTHAQQILRTDFEPSLHPASRMVLWTLSDSTKLRGLLLLKGAQKRPLVIFRPGVFSHLRTSMAERFILMQLFEEGPFHVLLLPGNTGKDYILDNHKFAIGGEFEGFQTAEILKYLSDPTEPLNHYVSKIHLAGISMGGHGIWHTQMYEKLNKNSILDRSLLFCPLINLKKTISLQESNPFLKFILDLWFKIRLGPLRKELGLSESDSILQFKETLTKNYVEHSPEWLSHYDFKNTFILQTIIDPVVPPAVNVDSLNQSPVAKQHQMILPRGFHCSLSTSYQWYPLSLTVRALLEPEALQNKNVQASWSIKVPMENTIKSLVIKNLSLSNFNNNNNNNNNKISIDQREVQLKLLLKFNNSLLAPKELKINIPTNFSDQTWVLSSENENNETLKHSLSREFASRLVWTQEANFLRIGMENSF